MNLDIELLEQCECDGMTFAIQESQVFGGDRPRLLNIVRHLARAVVQNADAAGVHDIHHRRAFLCQENLLASVDMFESGNGRIKLRKIECLRFARQSSRAGRLLRS